MTLVIIAGNHQYMSIAMDRRLTTDGRTIDEEASKGGLLECDDARLNFGFSGLAKFGTYRTDRWILQTLAECGTSIYLAKELIDCFVEKINDYFQSDVKLATLSDRDKYLTIVFAGFLYNQSPPRPVLAVVSNHEFYDKHLDSDGLREFKAEFLSSNRPSKSKMFIICPLGTTQGLNKDGLETLRHLLVNDAPYKAIVGKSVDIIRKAADQNNSFGLIGKQISTACIFSDPNEGFVIDYHTNKVSHMIDLFDRVICKSAGSMAIQWKIEDADPNNGVPMAIPKVSRNTPCPCNSGKKYKQCHGK